MAYSYYSDNLEKLLKALKESNVEMFQSKFEDNHIQIVFHKSEGTVDVEEKDEMEEKDISMYNTSNIGITRRGFDDDEEEKLIAAHKRVKVN